VSAARDARALVAAQSAGLLATSSAGHPWGSLVAYGTLDDGSPVLLVSRMAEHGRNLMAEPRASLVVTDLSVSDDPLACPRVTLAGHVRQPSGDEAREALAAFVAAVPHASDYARFADFTLWVLRVERVRWVEGYGRMESIDAPSYREAE
jgi:heme iron utilization protein